MRAESGRSLIEIIGVLAITGVMAVSSIGIYSMIRKNQTRTIASHKMEQIASDVKLLMEMRGSYEGISVDYLIKSGALKTDAAPIGGDDWSVTASSDGTFFAINLTNLSESDCDYFAVAIPQWASAILINGYETEPESHCFAGGANQVSLIVK